MCLAPRRHTLFPHLNFQKWSEPVSFLHFRLENVLGATTAYTFSISELPKVVRTRQFFTLLASKFAWRHNGVHFFEVATSKNAPKVRCFVRFDLERCFASQRRAICHLSFGQMAPHPLAYFSTLRPEPQIIGKHSESRLSYFFAHLHLLPSHSFSSLIFSSLLFSSDSSRLCFSNCPYCRKFPRLLYYLRIMHIYITWLYIQKFYHMQSNNILPLTIHDSSWSTPAEAAIHCVLGEVFVAHQFRTAKHLSSQALRNGSGRMICKFPEILDKRM